MSAGRLQIARHTVQAVGRPSVYELYACYADSIQPLLARDIKSFILTETDFTMPVFSGEPSSSMPSATDRIAKRFIGAVEDEWQLYTDNAADYTRGPPIGFGASSTVYTAIHHPPHSRSPSVPCALKVLDLDTLPPGSLRLLRRETQLMSLSKHPNVLRVRGSWMDGHKLYIALRLMNAGSAADVMRYGWPGGMEEEVVRCILKQALQGLNYLHINGFIHRDVKAANLLIDDDGTVLLGDLGVAAPLQDDDQSSLKRPDRSYYATPLDSAPRRPRAGKRHSFVGTPCWMAPELIAGKHYDASADIWSFGITALELAQGRAPYSRESSHTVLLRTVQDAPPTLDREGGVHKYSRAFKDMVESCLVKDPSKRPTAEHLLQTPFFKNAKKKSSLVGSILMHERQMDCRPSSSASSAVVSRLSSCTAPSIPGTSPRACSPPRPHPQSTAAQLRAPSVDGHIDAVESGVGMPVMRSLEGVFEVDGIDEGRPTTRETKTKMGRHVGSHPEEESGDGDDDDDDDDETGGEESEDQDRLFESAPSSTSFTSASVASSSPRKVPATTRPIPVPLKPLSPHLQLQRHPDFKSHLALPPPPPQPSPSSPSHSSGSSSGLAMSSMSSSSSPSSAPGSVFWRKFKGTSGEAGTGPWVGGRRRRRRVGSWARC
ncbi:hypothetical protein EW146_g3393 [Bondarzewia mesenterica]|uniref:Protein kinase domain-containing protein n=1 Tax=Bondarzewia mesenterica TaxID=1095465 RepID=A0A4S4LZH2_9AGAM|nr:hypothetical protein EW146_g3393 [Bondarzewia mesenterica]